MPETPPGVVHPDSIEQHDASSDQTEKKKSRRPASECPRILRTSLVAESPFLPSNRPGAVLTIESA
jgi:hypothetical protein